MNEIRLEIGKTYITRDGSDHFEITRYNTEDSDWGPTYDFIGKCVKAGNYHNAGEYSAFYSNGGYFSQDEKDSSDLVKEVVNVQSTERIVSNELVDSLVNRLLSNYTIDELKQYAYDRMMDEYSELSDHQLRQLSKQLGVPSE